MRDDTNRGDGDERAFRPPSARQIWLGVVVATTLAVALVAGIAALAASPATAFGGGARWHGGGGHRHDPERIRAHAELGVEWALRWADATDEQQAAAKAIVAETTDALLALGVRHRAQSEEIVRLLSAPTIDRAALERLRQEELSLAEEASRALVDSLADVAEVLTPEQRTRLAELAQRFHHDG